MMTMLQSCELGQRWWFLYCIFVSIGDKSTDFHFAVAIMRSIHRYLLHMKVGVVLRLHFACRFTDAPTQYWFGIV